MSEMIERVARAIGDIHYGYVDPEETPNTWASCMNMARAAIEAMLEPNNKMLHEAAKAMSTGRRPTPDRVSVNEKHKIRYKAMIREALK